jgi:hypothetical protein
MYNKVHIILHNFTLFKNSFDFYDIPFVPQVAGRHLPLFEAYYKELDPKNTNNIGALNAAKFLKNSGLPDALLSKVSE